MVVSQSGARKLLSTLPMRHPFDIHINAMATAALRKRSGMDKLRLFWTVPAMMAQTDEVRLTCIVICGTTDSDTVCHVISVDMIDPDLVGPSRANIKERN